MTFNKQTAFQLFFPAFMEGVDFTNLSMSGIKRVQLFYLAALNLPRQLEELARMGVKVTLRLEEPPMVAVKDSYYEPLTHPQIRAGVTQVKQRVEVEAVIVGNEPEIGYDLTWRSTNWGNNPDTDFPDIGGRALAHGRAVAGVKTALRNVCQVISPGWSHQRLTPRWHDKAPRNAPQPGRMTWRELCLGGYNVCDGNGVHIYAHDWASEEDENRYLWTLGEEVARCHRAVWINETSINKKSMDEVTRMAKIRLMADLIASVEWGGRVVSFTPFVSNGLPDEHWSHMRMMHPQAYFELGQWLQT